MKKILFFHHRNIFAGAGLCAWQILRNISQEEFEVTVCIPNEAGELKAKIEDLGMVVRTDIPKPFAYMHINGAHKNFFSPWHIKNIIEISAYKKIVQTIIENEKPDIVIVNSMTLFWIGAVAKKNNLKAICFHRETYCKGMFGIRTAKIKNELNKYFDKIVFISNYDLKQTGSDYSKYLRITDKVEHALYEGLDKSVCRRDLNLPEGKLVLFTGGASKLKGVFTLLKAMRFLKTDAKIVILQCEKPKKTRTSIGIKRLLIRIMGMDTSISVWKYIEKYNLKKHVILRGRTDCVEKYFVACDLVVFPSYNAHQARPIYEAGFAKRPIIVSDFPNTSEYLTNDNGWLVPYNDAKAWARCIDSVLQGKCDVEMRVEKNYNKVLLDNNYETLQGEIKQLLTSIS